MSAWSAWWSTGFVVGAVGAVDVGVALVVVSVGVGVGLVEVSEGVGVALVGAAELDTGGAGVDVGRNATTCMTQSPPPWRAVA